MRALARKSLQLGVFALGFAAFSSARGANDPELPRDLTAAVRAAAQEEGFDAVRQAGAPRGSEPFGWLAPNRSLAMRTHFADSGLSVRPMAAGGARWRWGAKLVGFGREGALERVSAAAPEARDNVVSYERGGLVEWYVNDERGLEQGFTILVPPAGASDAHLVLELALDTELKGELCDGDSGALFRDECGEVALGYLGLAAWDAAGHELDARVALDHQTLRLLVDDAGAEYPITVDPLIAISEVKLLPPAPANFGGFGALVAVDGDTAAIATSGSVYVFERIGGAWVQQAGFAIPATALDLEGDTLVIGAAFAGAWGRVFVYQRSGATWQFFKSINNPVPHSSKPEEWGAGVAVEGEKVAILNSQDTSNGGRPIHIYRYSAALGQYRHEARLGGVYGSAMELRGDDLYAPSAGIALRHWRFDAALADWVFVDDLLTASAAITGIDFASDDLLVVGSGSDGTLGATAGAVYVLERFAGQWKETAKLYSDTPLAGNRFGDAVAAYRNTLFAGERRDTLGTDAGGFTAIARNGGWTAMGSFAASDTVAGDFLGKSLDATSPGPSADVGLLVGAWFADAGASNSGAAYFIELAHQDAQVYCTSKINSLGCIPRIAFSGTPSASSAAPFTISVSSVINQKNGVFLFGTAGRAATPFEGGTLCVQLPKRMTGIGNSGGSTSTTDCSGTFSLDLNAQIQSGAFPTLVAGATVGGQFWYRDPGDPLGVGLTEAVEFVVQP